MKRFGLNKKQISDAELRRRKRGRQHGSVPSTPALSVKVDDQEGVLESKMPKELRVLFEVERLSIDDASCSLLEWYENALAVVRYGADPPLTSVYGRDGSIR
tara:strand:- start:96 stop:401 length:306 start_codon:yes stop_codon:yes gene_type:complete